MVLLSEPDSEQRTPLRSCQVMLPLSRRGGGPRGHRRAAAGRLFRSGAPAAFLARCAKDAAVALMSERRRRRHDSPGRARGSGGPRAARACHRPGDGTGTPAADVGPPPSCDPAAGSGDSDA